VTIEAPLGGGEQSDMKSAWSGLLASLVIVAGCSNGAIGADEDESESESESLDAVGTTQQAVSGKSIFEKGTFGGNGLTCATCHGADTGTFSLAEAQALFNSQPSDPLFRRIDSDDGTGASYHRLLDHGTVLVSVPLAPGVVVADDPTATSVQLERSIPSTLNTPALDPVLMWDGRAPSLEAQALGAIQTHAQGTETPSAATLAKIADYEESLFSSKALKKYASGGPTPTLPPGKTLSEKRGRLFFIDVPFVPPSLHGFCASCHSGPLINTTNQYNPLQPPGLRFSTALVSELNERNLPLRTYLFPVPGGTVPVTSPDPGRALITGNVADVNTFKIPSLWNIKNTGPYFHDGSAKTLVDVVNQYQKFTIFFTGLSFTQQELNDMVAYMKIL
jgi:cytochrome c peroxidase